MGSAATVSEMKELWRARVAADLAARAETDGGFAAGSAAGTNVEATAWAACALGLAGQRPVAERACELLAALQRPDGRVPAAPMHPGAAWTTALAVLAWRASGGFEEQRRRAIDYLLAVSSEVLPRDEASPVSIDSTLRGWPWVERTFGWVTPTAQALLALEVEGRGEEARAIEGRRLILDRQLPSGGWNYGNTFVFDSELLPAPEDSGPALAALAGRVKAESVEKSLDYLEREARRVRTPRTLSGAVLALAAWARRPDEADAALVESLEASERYGGYDPGEIALLILAGVATRGLAAALASEGAS